MKSVTNLVFEAIESFRDKVAIWDNPDASLAQKAEVVKFILTTDSKLCEAIAKLAIKSASTKAPTKAEIEKTVAEMKTVAEPPESKQTTIVLGSVPASKPIKSMTPAPATTGPRILSLLPVGGSVFATKLNGVAAEMHLGGEKSPLGKFRDLMSEDGKGPAYWLDCRRSTEVLLGEKLLKEHSDWELLITKIKKNIFFGGKVGEAVLSQCPKELLVDLLLAEDGLWNLVEEIRKEDEVGKYSPARVSFVIDACVKVGEKDLLLNCKHAVNRMGQLQEKGRSQAEVAWLIAKVKAMKQPKLARPPATPIEKAPEPAQTGAVTDHKLDNIQQVAEAQVSAPVEPLVLEGGKPAPDPDFERDYAQLMLAESAGSIN